MRQSNFWLAVILATLAGAVEAAADANAAGDPRRGGDLARALCSICHLVTPEQRGPILDGVPSFMAIAREPGVKPDQLDGRLLAPPHPAMPEPPLDRQQRLDLVAYIVSLQL